MPRYIYDGPVKEFDTIVADHWKGETIAPSESRARTNLTYQYKKSHNKNAQTRITLTGAVTQVD